MYLQDYEDRVTDGDEMTVQFKPRGEGAQHEYAGSYNAVQIDHED